MEKESKARRYGVSLSEEDVNALGLNPDSSTAEIKKSVRAMLKLPVVKTQKETLCEALGIDANSSAKEIREATIKKLS